MDGDVGRVVPGTKGSKGRPSKLDSFTRIHPTVQPESEDTCQADGPTMETQIHNFSSPEPLGSAGSVGTLQAPPLVSTDGETAHVDIKLHVDSTERMP